MGRGDLTAAEVRRLLAYCPETGELHWREPVAKRRRGARAGHLHKTGYRQVFVCGHVHDEHRLVWLHVYGVWPPLLDHINGVKDDNRIANLRIATRSQNAANAKASARNKAGIKGVSRIPSGRWVATISASGRRHYLGSYATAEEASAAYAKAAVEHFGEFARAA